jgi:hypothetical protein
MSAICRGVSLSMISIEAPGSSPALHHNPELLVIRPAPPSAGLNDLEPFNLSTALIAVHKDSYASLKLAQQGGFCRRETKHVAFFTSFVTDVGQCFHDLLLHLA